MSKTWADVRALLIDLEGTLTQAGQPVPGAADALKALAWRGIPHVCVTNTTSRPRGVLAAELEAMGLPDERVLTAPIAGRRYLLERGWTRCHLMVRPAVLEDFAGITPVERGATAVVVGDLGDQFTYERLNLAFRLLIDGAELVTLARNRYYRASDGLVLDQGPFVCALEQASGKEATLVGKPSSEFFLAALEEIGLQPSLVAVVGDDVEVDVAGGMALGMKGILVRTGKFREESLSIAPICPDAVIDSAADLARLLE